MYKTKLQELCHDRKLGLPKYYTMKDGPDHMPTFKATVYVNNVTFTSQPTFTSSKQAQSQAAMLAFNTFSSPPYGSSTPTGECDTKQHIETEKAVNVASDSSVIQNITCSPCKSQLQNYALRNNLDPSIFASETEAEQSATEVSLTSLSVDIPHKGESSSFKNKLQELTQRKCYGKPTYKTIQSVSLNMPTFFATVEVESKEFHGKFGKSKKEAQQNAAKVAYLALKEYELKEVELQELSPANNVKLSRNEQYYNVSKTSSSYLLCNRFKVYKCFPNIAEAFTKGITVMPIADNKWVTVSLEFPNEGL